jgi:hypothetical protein
MPHELRPPHTTRTPMWETSPADPDLSRAAHDHPTVATWLDALAGLGETALTDNREEQLYSQAPDALRQRSIEPSPEAVEAWVQAHRANSHT